MKEQIKQDLKRILDNLNNENYKKFKEDIIKIYDIFTVLEYEKEKIKEKIEISNTTNTYNKKYPPLLNNKNIYIENIKEEPIIKENPNYDLFKEKYENQEIQYEEVKNDIYNTKKYQPMNLGFNDRISFQKNLFNDSKEKLDEEIKNIDSINSKIDMEKYIDILKNKYMWEEQKKEYFDRFFEMALRRFGL